MENFARNLYNFINNGGWISIIIVGAFGIILSAFGLFMTLAKSNFNIWLCIFDLFIISFSIWAIYNGVIKPIINHSEHFKVKECDKVSDLFKE